MLALFSAVVSASLTCTVKNAYNNEIVSEALCSLRSTNQSVLFGSGTTNAAGSTTFSFSFYNGEFLVRVTHPQFYVTDSVLVVDDDSPDQSITISISPILSTTSVRTVLRWGPNPLDLDSHVIIQSTGFPTDCREVFYGSKECIGSGGRITLDVDERFVSTTRSVNIPCG